MSLKSKLHDLKVKYQGKKMAPAFNALHTFLYAPNETTSHGSHVRAADDLKRTMNTVIIALVPCLIFGVFNTGYQHYAAIDAAAVSAVIPVPTVSLISIDIVASIPRYVAVIWYVPLFFHA